MEYVSYSYNNVITWLLYRDVDGRFIMLAAVQGVIRNNSVVVQDDDISLFNGRMVTIIINEGTSERSRQDKSSFFDSVGKIDIDGEAVNRLREVSIV